MGGKYAQIDNNMKPTDTVLWEQVRSGIKWL
jgi:hypothetical protein